MPVSASSLWLETIAVIAIAILGGVLHLAWHPLRRHFSDAWDIMTQMPWLTWLSAVLLLLAELSGEAWLRPRWSLDEVLDWQSLVLPLCFHAATEQARLLHGWLPVWPTSLLLPLVLALLSWRVLRFPYRYGPRRQVPAERWLLVVGMALSWFWLGLEITHPYHPLSEGWESLRLAMRTVFSAVTMAFSQIMILRLVIAWEQPEQPDDQKDFGLALEHCFARWRSLVALSVLDFLWLLLQSDSMPVESSRWLILEAMLLFAAVPIAVAQVPGTSLVQGAHAMQILGRALPALAGVSLTIVATLALVRYASAVVMGLTGSGSWQTALLLPLHALVLATVRNWVFLACVLTLLRHGLKPFSTGRVR